MSGIYLAANGSLQAIKEATRGTTPSSGTVYSYPVDRTGSGLTTDLNWLGDSGLRGSPIEDYDQVPGTRHDELDLKGGVYGDTEGLLILTALGGPDTVTGTGPYAHTIQVLNAASTGSQPPALSWCLFDAANYFTSPAGQLDSLEYTFSTEGTLDRTAKFIANPYPTAGTSVAAPFNALAYTTEHMMPGWDVSVSVGGSALTYIRSGTLTIARSTASVFTEGLSKPYSNFAGPIKVTGKLTAVVPTNSEPWSTGATPTALTLDQQVVVITFTDPNDLSSATNHSIEFTMSQVQFETPKRSLSEQYTTVDVAFTAEGNATDAASGYAPIAAVITNGQSAAY